MTVKPCTLQQANKLVETLHRHHKPVQGHRFSLGLWSDDGSQLHAVAICGRPVARLEDQQLTLEISRCASDGTKNAISQLYGAVCRAAKAMGFERVQTFTLPEEGGASMLAAGFELAGQTEGGSWDGKGGRARRTDQPEGKKLKWVRRFDQ